MEGWELGLIIGCSVLAVILLVIIARFVCKGKRDGNGENRPLLDGKTTSTAAALRFDKNIDGNGHGGNNGNGQHHGGHHGQQQQQNQQQNEGFLDAQATRRINAWVDEVERIRRTEGLVPLVGSGHPGNNNNSSSSANSNSGSSHHHSSGASHTSGGGDMLGDTPDIGSVVTPRTPNTLSPRISGVDMGNGSDQQPVGGMSSTQGVYMGYSPKVVQ